MGADGIVKDFEIGKYVVLCSCPCRIVLEVDQLTLKAAEEVLRNSVVIGVAAAGHSLPDAIGFQALPVGPVGILDTPDRKSTRLNSSHELKSRMPSSA